MKAWQSDSLRIPTQLLVRVSTQEGTRMNLPHRVELSQAERDELKALLSGGKHAVRKVKRAQILLAADAGASARRSQPALG
jgi:hypothetical protein